MGCPGILLTPLSLWTNLRGGDDVTDETRAALATRLAERDARARADAEELAIARQGTTAERHAAALELLERRNVDGAWALIGRDVVDGPLRRDFPLIRKLLIAASEQRGQEARAGLLASLIQQDHPDEVRGYVGGLVRRAIREADRPPSADGRRAFFQRWPGLVVMVLITLALAGLGELLRRR